MNKKNYLCLSLGLALLCSLSACEKEPFRQEPKPEPKPVKIDEPKPEPQPVEPAKPEAKAFEASDFKAEMLSADGVLTLPEHFIAIHAGALDAHKAQLKELIAPEVTELGEACLSSCGMLGKISLPKLNKLAPKALENCHSLSQVELPELTEAGDEAFAGCTALNKLQLPKLSKIGNKTFGQCNSLVDINLPELSEVGDEAFALCFTLTTCDLPKLSKVGSKAFSGLYRLRKLTLGATLPQMPADAFLNTTVAKALYVPESAVASYTDWANLNRFSNINGDASKLTANFDQLPESLKLGKQGKVQRNEDADAEGVEIENLTLKPTAKIIAEDTFNLLVNPDENILKGTFYALGVQKIESGAFNSQDGLSLVELPNATDVASGVFNGCKGLKTAYLPQLKHLRSTVFASTGLELVDLASVTSIEKNAFENCAQLKYVILGATPPQTPALVDINSPLNDSIFGLNKGASPVQDGQVSIVVPDEALPKYADWKSKYTQVKEIIPMSKFKR